MPFPRLKVRFNRSFGSSPRERHVDDPDTGICTFVVEDCNLKLPPAENFSIENQVKAGVTLNSVNTNILGTGIDTQSLSEAISSVSKKTSKKSSNIEVNNEN